MALGIIITSLVIVSGLLKIFFEWNKGTIEQNFEEMKNWFAIPSVLNTPSESLIQTPNQIMVSNKLEENFIEENSHFLNDDCVDENNGDPSLHQIRRDKKVIVYKSVTKRMTLVKVY